MISNFKARMVLDDRCKEALSRASQLRGFANEMQSIDDAIAAKRAELHALHQELKAANEQCVSAQQQLNRWKWEIDTLRDNMSPNVKRELMTAIGEEG
jgi:predicted  nucleic acid-binding Zn-ribbon protein